MTIAGTIWRLLPRLLISLAVLASAIAATDDDAAPAQPAAGQLLVASAQIQDPRFRESVILLIHHDKTGAFGVVINRPLGERPLASVLGDADRKRGKADTDTAIDGTIRVFLGGPVERQRGFVVHSADYRLPPTLAVADGIAMTANAEVLRAIARRKGPAKYLLALGYAGWGAGQLEEEIARRDWLTAPAEPALVFDADRDTLWKTALARHTQEL